MKVLLRPLKVPQGSRGKKILTRSQFPGLPPKDWKHFRGLNKLASPFFYWEIIRSCPVNFSSLEILGLFLFPSKVWLPRNFPLRGFSPQLFLPIFLPALWDSSSGFPNFNSLGGFGRIFSFYIPRAFSFSRGSPNGHTLFGGNISFLKILVNNFPLQKGVRKLFWPPLLWKPPLLCWFHLFFLFGRYWRGPFKFLPTEFLILVYKAFIYPPAGSFWF